MILSTVMDELATRLRSIGSGLRVAAYPPDTATPNIAVVTYPDRLEFDATFNRGEDTMTIPVVVLVGKVSDRATRNTIAQHVAGGGPKSIKAVLEGAGAPAFVDLPVGGGSGNFTTPNRPEFPGGSNAPFWVAADLTMDDWTPPAVQGVAASWLALFAAKTWIWQIATNGRPNFALNQTGGGADVNLVSTIPYGFTNGTRHAIGVHAEPAVSRATFYTAPELTGPWTLHEAITGAPMATLFDSQGAWFGAGDGGSTSPLEGDVYGFQMRAGDMNGPITANAPIATAIPGAPAFLDDVMHYAWQRVGDAAIVAGAGPAIYTSFDSCRVQSVEFDTLTVGGVDHLAATFAVEIIGIGA